MREYKYILTYDYVDEILTVNPDNWDDLKLIYQRHTFYHSVLRSVGLSLRFPIISGGGGQFIKDAYESEALEAVVDISIQKRNQQTNDYDDYYTGVLDFKRYIEDKTNKFIEIGLEDSNKLQKFIARDNIDFDLFSLVSADNITVPDFNTSYSTISMLPIDIFLDFVGVGNLDDSYTLTPVADTNITNFYLDTITINEFSDRFQLSEGSGGAPIYINDSGVTVNMYLNTLEFDLDIETVMSGASNANGSILYGFTIGSFDSDDNKIETLKITLFSHGVTAIESKPKTETTTMTDADVAQYEKFIGDAVTGTLVDKDQAYIEVPDNGYINFPIGATLQSSNLTASCTLDVNITDLKLIEVTVGLAESTTIGMFVHEAMTRIIQLTTSETTQSNVLYSELLGRTDSEFNNYPTVGDAGNEFITNAKLIRQFPNNALNVSVRGLFKTLDSIYNVGLGYDRTNDRFYIENKEEFYNRNILFNLGEVSDFTSRPMDMAYFSQLLTGYNDKVDPESFQGANEFNAPAEHSIGIPVNDKLDIQSEYSGSSIEMELGRRKPYINYANTDSKQDDKVFIVQTDGTDTIQGTSGLSGFSGIDKYYNLNKTPRENLLRWTNVISAALWRSSNDSVKFIKNQKDVDFTYTNQDGNSVNEQDDVSSLELRPRLFNPEIYKFEKPVDGDIISILNNDPHGIITFTSEGTQYACFVYKVETDDYNKTAFWECIAVEAEEVVTNNIIAMNGNNLIWMNNNNAIRVS